MPNRFQGIRACVFDAYGTLFDFASAAEACRDEIGPATDQLTALWREKQLTYTWLRAVQGRHADFAQVTADALDFALDTLDLDRPALRERLLNLYRTLKPFPEVPALLRRMWSAGMPAGILSNGTPEMVEKLVTAANLEDFFAEIMSVEAVGVFKPSPLCYQLAVDRFSAVPGAIAFLSSNGWDIHGASAFGFRTVWCNRYGRKRERLPGAPDFEITTLDELPEILGIA